MYSRCFAVWNVRYSVWNFITGCYPTALTYPPRNVRLLDVTRIGGRLAICVLVCATAWAQQPQPGGLPPDSQAQTQDDGTTPQPAPATKPTAQPKDPKTGLELTPAEQMDRALDQIDPLKPYSKNSDKSSDDADDDNRLTDRENPADPDKPPATKTQNGALPGSIAATNANTPDGAGYTGPAVLTRSYTLARPMNNQQLSWQASVGFMFSQDRGQANGVAAANGTYPSITTNGRTLTWGLTGRHIWKRDQLGVSYVGNYSDYTSGGLSGMNNSLNLDFAHIVTRRISLQLVQSVQLLSQNYSLENPTLTPGSSVANINLATSPNVELPGDTTRQSNSTASLTFHQTHRLSWQISSGYFIIGHTGAGFTGSRGYQAGGDLNYRMTRKATVGAFYSYTDYRFSHDVSHTDSQGFGAIYSYALTGATQLRTRLGASHLETLGLAVVPLPPEIAIFLGQRNAVIDSYSHRWISDISAELVHDFHRNRTATLSYARGQSPGNGVLFTSAQESISAGFAMRLFRRVPIYGSATRSTLTSASTSSVGSYSSDTFSFSTSRQLHRGVTSNLTVDYRRYQLVGSPLLQHDLRISLGLNWSPPANHLQF